MTPAPPSSGHPHLVFPDGHHVATMQLAATTVLRLAVDADGTVLEQDTGIRSRVDEMSQLEELAQADHAVGDGNVAHGTIMSRLRVRWSGPRPSWADPAS